jgi:uncharacterized membrane protein/nitrite reductase/ring-hydroxylating ferredoxin subunit
MNWEKLIDQLVEQPWVEPVANAIGQLTDKVFRDAGGPVENFLHGLWLGHPLHPVLTDLPLGSWMVAATLDVVEGLTGSEQRGADAAVVIGLAGATMAATAGLSDWNRTDGRPRKLGAVHATLNIGATVLYTLSALRKARNRGLGRAFAFTGFGVVATSAYLGGHLVYAEQVGVDHAVVEKQPGRSFKPVLADAELGEGQLRRLDVDGAPVMLARCEGLVYALLDTCSHLVPLAEGQLEVGPRVRACSAMHGSRYTLSMASARRPFDSAAGLAACESGQIEVSNTEA